MCNSQSITSKRGAKFARMANCCTSNIHARRTIRFATCRFAIKLLSVKRAVATSFEMVQLVVAVASADGARIRGMDLQQA